MSLNTKLVLVIGSVFLLILVLSIYSTAFQLLIINRVAAFQGFQLHQSIPYGNEIEQRLDIYQPPEKSDKLLPVVIFFYGGCWGACSTLKKAQYAFVAEAFSSNNMIAIVADYRLYPSVNFPDIMNDATGAVEWVHNNIEGYGGDSRQIFLMGHSSGAHVAAMLAVNSQYLSQLTYLDIKGFIGLAGPYNFLPFDQDYMPILFGPPMQVSDSQPIYFIDGTEPPSLLLYGADDIRVKPINIEGMAAKIQDVGGEVEKRIYEGVDHASILAAYSVVFRTKKVGNKNPIFLDTVNFIQKHVSQDRVRAPH